LSRESQTIHDLVRLLLPYIYYNYTSFINQPTCINIYMSDNNSTEEVKTLVDQLKENNSVVTQIQQSDFTLDKEDLEQFILNNTGRLIQDSMNTIDNIKQYIISAPEPEDVHSLAELYKASTTAIEALNKLLLQQQKAEAQVAIKTMDIESKKELADTKDNKLTFTRDEIFDKLLERGDLIEAELVDVPEDN